MPRIIPPDTVAAIDLGSNSFHMIVSRIVNQQLDIIDRHKEIVRLAKGLDAEGRLTPEAMDIAFDCLSRMGQRVRDMPRGSVRIVGTNTLRKARNSAAFVCRASEILNHPIEIIRGREEARLIYLGVSHSLADDGKRKLVVDIGGGSTELIIGEQFEPMYTESLYMGCVTMTDNAFLEGVITDKLWRQAIIKALLELQPIANLYRGVGWEMAVGASGTIQAVAGVIAAQGWNTHGIDMQSLDRLSELLIEAGSIDKLDIKGLASDRVPVFAGGVVVLQAVFKALNVTHMIVSDGALREGLIYDLIGRLQHSDVRQPTIDHLMKRFDVDMQQSRRVRETAARLFEAVSSEWSLDESHISLLDWAASLHEIGLSISHSQFHKHGAYLIRNADLPGFSRQEQSAVALLVRSHRRKFPLTEFDEFSNGQVKPLIKLAVILRLAVLLNRSRNSAQGECSIPALKAGKTTIEIEFEQGMLKDHPLTQADLENEAAYLKAASLKLKYS